MNKTLFYLYIIGWALYSIKDLLPFGDKIGPLFVVPLLGGAFYCALNIKSHQKGNVFLKVLYLFVIVISLFGIQPIIRGEKLFIDQGLGGYNEIASYSYLLNIYISLLPIYPVYFFSKKIDITSQDVTRCFYILFIFTLIGFADNYFKSTIVLGVSDVTNNKAYSLLPLMPLLTISSLSKSKQIIWTIIIAVLVTIGMKRGAILIGVIILLDTLWTTQKVSPKKDRLKMWLMVILGLLVLTLFVNYLYHNNEYFLSRISETLEGRSSHRDEMYVDYFDYYWEKSSIHDFIFGFGINSTIKIMGNYAHNDWIEFAYNEGLIGVSLLFLFFLTLVLVWKKMKRGTLKRAIKYIFIIMLFSSLYSMSLTSLPISTALCIGYCLAKFDIEKLREKKVLTNRKSL